MKSLYCTSTILVLGFVLLGCAGSVSPTVDVSDSGTGYPGCPYQVYRHSADGWLLTNPELHFVYWGQYWLDNPDDQNQYLAPWSKLLNGGPVLKRMSEYGVGAGSLDGTVYNTDPNLVFPDNKGGLASDGTLDASGTAITILPSNFFEPEINNEIQAGELPTPNSNTLYTIFTPPNYIPQGDNNLGEGGYHGHGSYGNQPYAYSIILYSSWHDETMAIISHELYEAASNPGNGDGWYDGNSGAEIGDLCQINNENWWEPIDGISVQKVWSQVSCQCE